MAVLCGRAHSQATNIMAAPAPSATCNPICVASYALLQDLPKPLRGKLPSAQQLKAVMAKVLEDVPATEKGTKRGARKRG